MKRKFELLDCDSPAEKNKSYVKKSNKIEISKRCREQFIGRQCWADEDVDCDIEVVKKGYGGNRRVIYNFIKVDVEKVPTYIL